MGTGMTAPAESVELEVNTSEDSLGSGLGSSGLGEGSEGESVIGTGNTDPLESVELEVEMLGVAFEISGGVGVPVEPREDGISAPPVPSG